MILTHNNRTMRQLQAWWTGGVLKINSTNRNFCLKSNYKSINHEKQNKTRATREYSSFTLLILSKSKVNKKRSTF